MDLPIPHIPRLLAVILISKYHLPLDLLIVDRTASHARAVVVAVRFPPDRVMLAPLSLGFQVA